MNYTLQCIQELDTSGKRFLVIKREAMDRYNQKLQQTLGASVWAAGCRSWYKTESGKIIGIYPGFSFQYMRELKRPQFDDYFIC